MNTFISLIAILFIGILFLVYIYPRVFIIRINGDSMEPTFSDGELLLAYRDFSLFEENSIYIYMKYGKPVIKRLINIKHLHNTDAKVCALWFEGDNSDTSKDSRHYGFIRNTVVIGKVLTKK